MSDAEGPTPERILELLAGYQRTHVLLAALELDLFSGIAAGATSASDLAARVGASPKGVRALADYLATLGLLRKNGTQYSLTPESALYLDRGSRAYLGEATKFLASPMLREGYGDALGAVRRGGSTPSHDSMAPNHPVWAEYARAMAPLFVLPAAGLAEQLLEDPRPVRRVLDVAAGHGLFGIALATRRPEILCTALDQPEVFPALRSHAAAAGVGERVAELPGDAFTAAVGHGWDVVIVANFLHHFDPPTIVRLLGRLREAMADGGRLAIVEFVPNEDRVSPPAVAQFAMTMVATTRAGDAYTFPELAAMIAAAGYGPTRRGALPGSPERWIVAERDPVGARSPPVASSASGSRIREPGFTPG